MRQIQANRREMKDLEKNEIVTRVFQGYPRKAGSFG